FDALQSALYAQDTWTLNPKLTLTLGVRADNSRFLKDNAYAPAVDSAYGPTKTAKGALQFSPRFGFNYDVTGDQINQLRGGIGLFVGTPPGVWMENAYVDNGAIRAVLTCGPAQSSPDPAPAFNADASGISTCGNGRGSKPIGNLSFLDEDLKFPQPMRANLAFDRVLPFNLVATIEGLYSRTLNQLFFVNRNITAPVGTDKFGRVMYGTIATTGISSAARPAGVLANGGTSRFASAIEATNQNEDYAYNLTGQLRKRYANNWEAYFAYSYGKARDVQSFTSSTHLSNWNFGRTLSGRQEDAFTGISLFDQPHKISAFATRTVPWTGLSRVLGSWASGLATDFTVSYQGVSGPPHDYVYGGSSNRGDMNADGSAGNDLIYIPRNTSDINEIRFQNLTASVGDTLKAADQAAYLEQLISLSPCLNGHRGEILPRNSCRLPWSNNFDVTVRQNVPLVRSSERLAIQLDIFNFGNLLNKNWGQAKVSPYSSRSNIPLLTHISQSSTDPANAVPTVTFNYRTIDPDKDGTVEPYLLGNFVSNYWRMQLSARVSF
ncbi:MAG TPA: TonB-dependent receptor, partial [Gemmatimonadaceae bacterium]|nr:TonB-dependent receptor [Gemmatimonadaceae bacterium]